MTWELLSLIAIKLWVPKIPSELLTWAFPKELKSGEDRMRDCLVAVGHRVRSSAEMSLDLSVPPDRPLHPEPGPTYDRACDNRRSRVLSVIFLRA